MLISVFSYFWAQFQLRRIYLQKTKKKRLETRPRQDSKCIELKRCMQTFILTIPLWKTFISSLQIELLVELLKEDSITNTLTLFIWIK